MLWEWLPLNGDVEGKYLEFVNREDGAAVGDYIVVLKFVKNQEELPQPIGPLYSLIHKYLTFRPHLVRYRASRKSMLQCEMRKPTGPLGGYLA
jgi:hypothetical protein